MFTMFVEARKDYNEATDNSDDAIKIALIVVGVALALVTVAALVALVLLRRRLVHGKRRSGAKQEASAPQAAERGSATGETANYTTLEL